MAEFTTADRVGSIGGYIGGIATLGNILNGAGNLMNGITNGVPGSVMNNNCPSSDNQPVNRYEAALMQMMTNKDTEISILRSEKYTDEKLVEVYKDINTQVGELRKQVQANKDEQYQINMQQATYNGVNNATIGCMQNQINALLSITKLVVPNPSVCPGWGNVTITPATSTTTTPTA